MRAIRQFNMKTTVRRDWLLERLRENRARHQVSHKEAVEGYRENVKRTLARTLAHFNDPVYIKAVSIHLAVPEDYTTVYDTVIGMLENNIEEVIALQADEYRMFAEDEWEWRQSWLAANSQFSNTAMEYASSKGWS